MAGKLIHVGHYLGPNGRLVALYLRQEGNRFRWYEERGGEEVALDLSAETATEAIRLAAERFVDDDWRPLECGMRFNQSERDEHGSNALFHQMVASYSSSHIEGNYFDEDTGHDCTVDQASEEALALWKRLQSEGRL